MAKLMVPGLADAESGFEPLAPGRYSVRINRAEQRTGKSGSPYFAVEAEVIGPDHAGRHLFWNWPTSPAGLGILKRGLTAAGIEVTDELEVVDNQLVDALGAELDVIVEHRSYCKTCSKDANAACAGAGHDVRVSENVSNYFPLTAPF